MKWRSERDAIIRQENGWLALAGLFWLKEGENRLGSDARNEILLPQRMPPSLGSIHFDGRRATLRVNQGLGVQVNGKEVDQAPLNSDRDETPSFITLDGIRILVIERPNGTGVRLWDNLRPERRIFPPREWFPINEAMRLPARYERYRAPKKVLLPDVFGEVQEGEMEGQVIFELEGRMYTLDASESKEHRLEIHFQDLTNGKQTYPSGRYYYTQEAPSSGKVMLDFNFAYNPPCAFTEYATCVFAPPENRLKIPIEAGEIFRGHPT
jgi:uncharacterized protein (DUF1684 family)